MRGKTLSSEIKANILQKKRSKAWTKETKSKYADFSEKKERND